MTFEQIKELIEIINHSAFQSFEINSDGTMLKLSKNKSVDVAGSSQLRTADLPVSFTASNNGAEKETALPVVTKEEVPAGNTVKSPIVGTFYQSSAPGNPNFVNIGDKVKKGEVLCIVEAMKVMNEVVSEFDGEVKAILADNESLVEYGQPLYIIG